MDKGLVPERAYADQLAEDGRFVFEVRVKAKGVRLEAHPLLTGNRRSSLSQRLSPARARPPRPRPSARTSSLALAGT